MGNRWSDRRSTQQDRTEWSVWRPVAVESIGTKGQDRINIWPSELTVLWSVGGRVEAGAESSQLNDDTSGLKKVLITRLEKQLEVA